MTDRHRKETEPLTGRRTEETTSRSRRDENPSLMLINAAVHGFNAIDGRCSSRESAPNGSGDDSQQYLRRRYYQRMDPQIELIFSDTKRLDRDRVGEIRCSPLEWSDPFTFTDRKYKIVRLLFNLYGKASCVPSLHFRKESYATRSRVADGGRRPSLISC